MTITQILSDHYTPRCGTLQWKTFSLNGAFKGLQTVHVLYKPNYKSFIIIIFFKKHAVLCNEHIKNVFENPKCITVSFKNK